MGFDEKLEIIPGLIFKEMIFLIYGTDTIRARDRARQLVSVLRNKKPDAGYVELEEKTERGKLEELFASQGLFGPKLVVFADGLLSKAEGRDLVVEKIPKLAGSENIFIFLEGKLEAKTVSVFKKWAEKAECHDKLEKKPDFNIFSLADYLGRKDKKNLWVSYQEALRRGVAPEEIHGTLFWQVKTLLIAGRSENISDSGLKPYSWTKAKSALRNWKEEELQNLASNLVEIYHQARRGEYELDTALERVILDL